MSLDSNATLLPCPCGKTPSALALNEGISYRYAYASPNCCGEWEVEFRKNALPLDDRDTMLLAIARWNGLPRSQPLEWVATKARQPDEHETVLAFHPDWGMDVCMRENGWPLQIGANMEYATHWMELPKPPTLLPPNVEAK